jgi:proton-coupled amino acid transporter
MLHYKACARTWKQKAADIALGVFGVVAAIYTTTQTIYVSDPFPAYFAVWAV